jgi:serine/threonine protein kinase
MEKCFNFSEKAHNYRCVDLKQGLFLMHHLKMIHFDIKPENIMYSSKFHKFVIIDFNLSDITNIKLGTKIKIGFRGTINYCSPDFVHNFLIPNEARLIDPYNNDIYCLRESLE